MHTHKVASTETIKQWAWALLLAFALCQSLTPPFAWAEGDDEGDGEFSVQLTIVDATDSTASALVNVKVDGMTADKTVTDLLASQGFAMGDQAASAADITGKTYFESLGAPYFLGKGYDAATGDFWACMYNGDGVVDYANAFLSAQLRPHGHYQYVYGTGSSFVYSESIPQLVSDSVNDSPPEMADSGFAPDSGPDEGVSTPINYDAFRNLYSAVQASFMGTRAEWQAMEMAAVGRASDVDVSELVKTVLSNANNPGNTDLQRGILALTAVGVDATAVPALEGGSINLIEQMATSPIAASTVNSKIFMLLAYESGPYAVPPGALISKDQLISDILAEQLPDGGYSYSGSVGESDMTALVIAGLAPYRGDAAVSTALDRAVDCLHALQLPNGGFSSPYDVDQSAVNVGSTAFVVIALSALGVDAATDDVWATESGVTPLAALLTQASDDTTGFLFDGSSNDLATEQGFRALVAYEGLKNTGCAYNIYTQARIGQAAPPTDQKQDGVAEGQEALPVKTSDETSTLVLVGAALALAALVASTMTARRVRSMHKVIRR